MSSDNETTDSTDVPTIGGYVDIEEQERQKFLEIDGVGEKTAEKLVEAYNLFDHAVDRLLGSPISWMGSIGRSKTDEIRDALQEAGYEPPCDCEHYEDVRNSQSRDDVFTHCETCGQVIQA